MSEWHENTAFWHELAPAIFTEQRMQSAATEVEHVIKLLELASGAAVLDLACGLGRHSVEFARRGYRVTGVDHTAEYLRQAAERAERESLRVEWVQQDMRSFRRPGAFDAVVNLLTSFGYFSDEADDRAVLQNTFASLKPGGRLLIDLMGKEVLARIFRPRDWQELPAGLLLEERTVDAGWSTLSVRWILIAEHARHEHRFQMRLLSAAELFALLRGAGFVELRAYGSLAGAPYDQSAERLVIAGRRPPSHGPNARNTRGG